MSIDQILAILIFAGMFIAIMSGKVHRFKPALIGAVLASLLILILVDDGPRSLWHVLRLQDFIDPHWWYGFHNADARISEVGGVNWQTMVFIGGMMVMVEGMGAAGFFRWLCLLVAKTVNYRVVPILVTFMLLLNTGIFLVVVVLLVTHAYTGLSVALIGVIAASLAILAAGRQAPHILKGVDWRTLLFFLGLFIAVGGLEVTGVLSMLADKIGDASGGSLLIAMTLILWLSAFASAIVDNIPFAATMAPVIQTLSITGGMAQRPLAWSLALGTDIGGNATPIGASANVVGTAIAEKEGYKIGWGIFCKYTIPATLLVTIICNAYLILRYA